MSLPISLNGAGGSLGLSRLTPTPSSTAGRMFNGVLNTVKNVASEVTGVAVGNDLQSLLEEQMRVNAMSQSITLQSNIEKSNHDSRMAAIRNVRVN